MKTSKSILSIVVLSLLLSSCGKLSISPKDDKAAGNSKVSGTMKAKLDGKAWAAKEISFGGLFSVIQVNGSIDENNLVSLEFIDTNVKPNTAYLLGKDKPASENQTLIAIVNGKTYLATSGNFKFAKYVKDKSIEGEMNAILFGPEDNREIVLENCTFSMTYN